MSEETIFTAQQLIDWCDKMASEGKNPVIKWEGGGDSGWCYMEDEEGERLDSHPEAGALMEHMYDTLDYGSWAGEFSANGEAPYNTKTKSFEGTDYYSESENTSCDAEIRIEIPAFIPFDRLEIQTEDEDCTVSCDIALDNGYVHPAAHDVMTNLEKQLTEEIPGAVDNHYKSGDDDQFDSFWHHYIIDRNQFKREGDMMVHILKEVHFSIHNVVDKDICIDLKDIAEYE